MSWVDQRFFVWVWPISAVFIVGLTVWSAIFPFLIFFGSEGIGVTLEKKVTVAAIFLVIAIVGTYICVGIYQLFFVELRTKFIVRKVVPLGEHYYLDGYYFKKTKFDGADVASVEIYLIKPRFGRNIATMLSWAPQTKQPNYKVTLNDGREFYLPGDMTDVENLKTILEKSAQENVGEESE